MKLVLKRYAYMRACTLGLLSVDGQWLPTIERPWVKGSYKGGKNYFSCVPDGKYNLIPFTRPNGDQVYALHNPSLGVWLNEADRPDGKGRYLILIHPGNWVTDVVGCIAPGLRYKIDERGRHMVTSSRAGMSRIMQPLGFKKGHKIVIESPVGAVD